MSYEDEAAKVRLAARAGVFPEENALIGGGHGHSLRLFH
jgi:hypothetical protein